MPAEKGHDQLRMMTKEDYDRIGRMLRDIGGPHVTWGAKAHLDVWMVEHQMRAERLTNARLTQATWGLVAATVVLAIATIALVYVTLGTLNGG